MERRFLLFLVLSFAILFGYSALMMRLNPPKPRPQPPAEVAAAKGEKAKPGPKDEPPAVKAPDGAAAEKGAPPAAKEAQPAKPAEGPDKGQAPPAAMPRKWITLGSADPADPYRELVTLTSRGAAVVRVELNSPRYRDQEDRSGYLGHLVIDRTLADATAGKGCLVQVVGPGTPASMAGLKPGDLIEAVNGEPITRAEDLRQVLATIRPGREVSLSVVRGKQKLALSATLGRRPLEVIRPDDIAIDDAGNETRRPVDHLSLLLTLAQIDKRQVPPPKEEETVAAGSEMDGLDLWSGDWEVVPANREEAVFRRLLPKEGIEITKTYRLAKVPDAEIRNLDYGAYHLVLGVTIRNVGQEPRQVAYQLDGPNGLPTEGWWYASKVGRDWGAVGLRDVVVSFGGATPSLVGAPKIADNKIAPPWQSKDGEVLSYIGVDAQYFSSVLIPQKEDPKATWFAQSQVLRIGKVNERHKNLTNTSCRVVSKAFNLAPGGTVSHEYTIFTGPKKPSLLAGYGLDQLVYYGWFEWVAVPLSKTLHVFYALVQNYGVAILMLTVLVRGCMFPLSRKQALGAQKMQELQPEIKKIQEKYKKDVEARTKAQQELFRKHNYNPLSGCLVIFIQLPIFVALYRSLMVDIELRQASLISDAIRWCSDLAAPDMLFDWSRFMPDMLASKSGWLGPYFNVLPIITVVLFIVQQKMFMPPPADEQAAMQQKVMSYMMIFIGVMFFKVASGLCIYFIASSLWGLAERKFLPKVAQKKTDAESRTRAEAKAQARADAAAERDGKAARERRKNRGSMGSGRDL